MADRDVTVRLNYEVSGNAIDYLRRLEAAQLRVASGQQGVSAGMPGSAGGQTYNPFAGTPIQPGINMPSPGGGGGGGSGGGGYGPNARDKVLNSLYDQRRKEEEKIAKQATDYAKKSQQIAEKAMREEEREAAAQEKARQQLSLFRQRTIAANERRAKAEQDAAEREQRRLQREQSSGDRSAAGMAGLRNARLVASMASIGAYHVTLGAAEGATNVINQNQRGDLSDMQRSRAALREMPIIGRISEAGIGLAQAIDGITERMRRSNQQLSIDTAQIQANASLTSARGSLGYDRQSAAERAASLGAISPVHIPLGMPRETFGQEFEYQRASRRAPLQQAVLIAEAERDAANRNVSSAERGVGEIDESIMLARRRMREMMMRQSEFNAFHAGSGGAGRGIARAIQGVMPLGPAGMALGMLFGAHEQNQSAATAGATQGHRVDHQNNMIAQTQTLASLEDERIRRLERVRQASDMAAQAELNLARMRLNLMREDLNMLQERERMMSRGAASLMTMSPGERQVGMNALREIQMRGIQNVPWFQIQQAMRVAPNTVNQMAVNAGQTTPEFAELNRLGEFGSGPENNVTELRDAITKLSNEMRSAELLSEQQSANNKLLSIDITLSRILSAIENRGNSQVALVGLNLAAQNANQQ